VPAVMMLGSLFYVFVVLKIDQPTTVKLGICILTTYIGMYLPIMFVKNIISKRQLSIKRAFPDALDLLLICVESGMSIEAAFKKVALEVGTQSIPLAEELTLTTAELSYLQDRRILTVCDRYAWRSSNPSAMARQWAKRCASWRRRTAKYACRRPRRRRPGCRRNSPCR
jgi:hypothetical protein